jgi:hypothetical protein
MHVNMDARVYYALFAARLFGLSNQTIGPGKVVSLEPGAAVD